MEKGARILSRSGLQFRNMSLVSAFGVYLYRGIPSQNPPPLVRIRAGFRARAARRRGGGSDSDQRRPGGQPAAAGRRGGVLTRMRGGGLDLIPRAQNLQFCFIIDRFYKVIFAKNPGALRAPETFIIVMVYEDILIQNRNSDPKSHFATPLMVFAPFCSTRRRGQGGGGF